MTATLKPCPFCGSPDLETCLRDGRPTIWCTSCTAMGAPADTPEAAAEAWNRRPGEDDAAFDAWAGEYAADSRDD